MTKKKKLVVPQPGAALLVKLGSIAVHVEELLSPEGHAFDRLELLQLLEDLDVLQWLGEMDALGLLPLKRNRRMLGKEDGNA